MVNAPFSENDILHCEKCPGFRIESQSPYYPFSFYYKTNSVNEQKYMFIMQNPGLISNITHSDEYNELRNNTNNENYIDTMRRWLSHWLINKNSHFTNSFFTTLRENNLIDFDTVNKYLNHKGGSFYQNFIVTDLVKCRKATKDISDTVIDTCGENYLSKEIDAYKNIRLIFSFSTRTWKYLRENKVEKIEGTHPSITQDHGHVYKIKNSEKYIIPLAHFSKTVFNYYLRDSYFEYLGKGLKEYARIIS